MKLNGPSRDGPFELNRIRQYVFDNPAGWAEDPENAAK
jgi:hypothetical protein